MSTAGIWRTDLLRVLAEAEREGEQYQAATVRAAAVLGFERQAVALPEVELEAGDGASLSAALSPSPAQQPAPAAQTQAFQQALQARMLSVAGRTAQPTDDSDSVRSDGDGQGLTLEHCQPRTPGQTAPQWPLERRTRLWPRLWGSLRVQHRGPVDVRALVKAIALGRLPRRPPRRSSLHGPGSLWVVRDVAARRQPFELDEELLLREIERLQGPSGLTVVQVLGRPDQPVRRRVGRGAWQDISQMPQPPRGSRMLILGDLGAPLPGIATHGAWLGWLRELVRSGMRPVAWATMGQALLSADLASTCPVYLLGGGGRLSPAREGWATAAQRQRALFELAQGVAALKTLASCCLHLEPQLLRTLRMMLGAWRDEPLLESRFWIDPDVSPAPASRPLRAAAAPRYRLQIQSLPPEQRVEILAAMRVHHGQWGRSIEVMEASIWQANAGLDPRHLPEDLAAYLKDAERWLRALQVSARSTPQPGLDLRDFGRDVLARNWGDGRWHAASAESVAALWARADLPSLPSGLAADVAAQALAQQQASNRSEPEGRLVQRGAALWWWPQALPLAPGAFAIAPVPATQWLLVRSGDAAACRHDVHDHPVRLTSLAGRQDTIRVWARGACVILDWLSRPRWALELGRDRQGLYVLAPTPWGVGNRMAPIAMTGEPLSIPQTYQSWASYAGAGRPDDLEGSADLPGAEGSRHSRVRVAILHAHEDASWHRKVLAKLREALPDLAVDFWHDELFALGSPWSDSMQQQLKLAHVVLVLVSPGLVTSKQFREIELPALLQGMRKSRSQVLPVSLRAVERRFRADWGKREMWAYRQGPLASLSAESQAVALEELAQAVRGAIGRATGDTISVEVRGATSLISRPRRSMLGADDRHGLYVDWIGSFNGAMLGQRFRYIPPGEFWMGARPEGLASLGTKELNRMTQYEAPRHQVRLPEGYWLADTACTQALWLAVMGGQNPSHFQDDPRNPVEQVSWNDVQEFLNKLQEFLPDGCEAVLPTEAEWEYACRAGTESPFSFGHTVTTDQVNCRGDRPYEDAPKRAYREQPLAVKSLPANGWGLYEMHGNVWEWCSVDGSDELGEVKFGQILENRIGVPDQGPESRRPLRGGSWYHSARHARASVRVVSRQDFVADYVGFRIALKSTRQAATFPMSAPVSGSASGSRGNEHSADLLTIRRSPREQS